MVQIPRITSPRFSLRELRDEDAGELHRILQNPEVLRYFPSRNPPTMAKVEKLVESQQVHWDKHGYGWWALADGGSDALIGWCGLNYLPDTDEVELKYLLAEDCWGKGIATEASLLSLRAGIMGTAIEQVVGIVHPENIASQRVLEKVGMSFVNEAHYFGMDCLRYILTRETYEDSMPITS